MVPGLSRPLTRRRISSVSPFSTPANCGWQRTASANGVPPLPLFGAECASNPRAAVANSQTTSSAVVPLLLFFFFFRWPVVVSSSAFLRAFIPFIEKQTNPVTELLDEEADEGVAD
jgi:hypothetical protein